MEDKYWVYRPILDLIGFTEGTDAHDGYNETLAYGKFSGGDVKLVAMNLREVDALQTKMLKHPDNNWNSSAVGRYQIVRTTLRSIRRTLDLKPDQLFNAEMQDRMACFLLGQRGIDKWLAGRMGDKTLINNLAHEWASLPKWQGGGAYEGQKARVTSTRVMQALGECKARHKAGQPKTPVSKEVTKVVEDADKGLNSTTTGAGFLGIIGTFFAGFGDLKPEVQFTVLGIVVLAFAYIIYERRRKANAAKAAKEKLG